MDTFNTTTSHWDWQCWLLLLFYRIVESWVQSSLCWRSTTSKWSFIMQSHSSAISSRTASSTLIIIKREWLLTNVTKNSALTFDDFRYSLTRGLMRLFGLGAVVAGAFVIIWLPWLSSVESFLQVVHRIFPIYRGIFEDKVSNVWCVVNVFMKIKLVGFAICF